MPALLLRFLPYALILAGVVMMGWWLRHSGHEAGEAQVQAQWDQQRADQTAAALGTLQAAIERSEAERKVREQEAHMANATLLQGLNLIETRLGGIRRQLQEQIANDPECAKWAAEPVRCNLSWRLREPTASTVRPRGPWAGAVCRSADCMPDAYSGRGPNTNHERGTARQLGDPESSRSTGQ